MSERMFPKDANDNGFRQRVIDDLLRNRVIAEEEMISVPKGLLDRICGMVYATRGEQSRLDYITDEEYGKLVSLRHSGHDSIATVLSALGGQVTL